VIYLVNEKNFIGKKGKKYYHEQVNKRFSWFTNLDYMEKIFLISNRRSANMHENTFIEEICQSIVHEQLHLLLDIKNIGSLHRIVHKIQNYIGKCPEDYSPLLEYLKSV